MQIKIGDVVIIKDPIFWEPLYSNSNRMGDEDIQVEWYGEPALVIDIVKYSRSYNKIKLMVNGKSGWTYSDYVELVSAI
jgi:ABC-type glycerol-3-phosphate transport system substrate-binding protein